MFGDNNVIGAASVVTKDIPANTLAYGNPSQIQKRYIVLRQGILCGKLLMFFC